MHSWLRNAGKAKFAMAGIALFALGFFSADYYANREFQLERQASIQRQLRGARESRAYALPLNNPDAVSVREASHMHDDDLVYGLVVHGHARAYPRWIMVAYHVANDTIDGTPVLVSQCEICSSSAAFVPILEELPLGPLVFTPCGYNGGTFRLCDGLSGSYWQPFSGRAYEGPLKGKSFRERIPVVVQRWRDWVKNHPDTDVILASENLKRRPHGRGPETEIGAEFIPREMKATADLSDTRLASSALIFGVFDGQSGRSIAFPLTRFGGLTALLAYQHDGQRMLLVRNGEFTVTGFYVPEGTYRILSASPLVVTDDRGGLWDQFGFPRPQSKSKLPLRPLDGYFAEWYEWINAHPHSEIFEGESARSGLDRQG